MEFAEVSLNPAEKELSTSFFRDSFFAKVK